RDVMRELREGSRGELPLLPLVRDRAAPQARRVLPAPSRERGTRAPGLALLRRRSAGALQRLGRRRRARGRLARRSGEHAPREVPRAYGGVLARARSRNAVARRGAAG